MHSWHGASSSVNFSVAGRAELSGSDHTTVVYDFIRSWSDRQLALDGDLIAVDSDPELKRHYLRFRGREKEIVTVWVTVQKRTVKFETYLLPAPEENVKECLDYLMKRNYRLHPLHLGIGPEEAVYLVGRIPLVDCDELRFDEMIGSMIAYTDEIFPTAMSIGFRSRYRRRIT